MNLVRIINGLESMDATGGDARKAARLGFLEWAFCGLDDATPEAARDALNSPQAKSAQSDAARAFVGYLKQATMAPRTPMRRRSRLLN